VSGTGLLAEAPGGAKEIHPGRFAPWAQLLRWRRDWLAVDTNPKAIAFAATLHGRLAILAGFLAILAASGQVSTPNLALSGVALLGVMLFPAKRLEIVTAASVVFFVARPFRIEQWRALTDELTAARLPWLDGDVVRAGAAVAFLAFAFGFLAMQRRAASRQSAMLIVRRPLLVLLCTWFIVFAAALAAPAGSLAALALWTMTGVGISSVWMLAYAAMDQRAAIPAPLYARAAMARPFWGGGAEGIGKSWGYLAKFDAKTDDERAATRLKALKLAVWALILTGVWQASEQVFRGVLGLHSIDGAVLAHAAGAGAGLAHQWASLVTSYLIDLLVIAVWGHFIVAIVRMLGWRIPRNTRNPLASRTLAEFWNRYFFYFKEMLVDFFFFPAFQRWFKKSPKLRIAFATFCAAGAGNFLFHFIRETHVFAETDIMSGLAVFQSAAFYSLALAAGLVISQWRGVKLSPQDGFLRWHVLPRVNVFAFFCLLKIFDDLSGEGSFSERAAFTASLFGA
jgi:hypothetical protein